MNRDDRKKLTANELYMNECMTILYTKIKSAGFNFFDKNGRLLSKNIFNIENYRHGTITCIYNPNSIKVCYDGTNFNPVFVEDGNGGFAYKLEPLGIEYICNERNLDEEVCEKKVVRKVGNSADYYRYLCSGDFFILLEHFSRDTGVITSINNTAVKDFNDSELISYMKDKIHLAEEIESEYIDDDDHEYDEEMLFGDETESEMVDNYEEGYKESDYEFSLKDQEEIEAYSSDDEYTDLYMIDYSLADILGGVVSEEPYRPEYTDKIEDFDYQRYINNVKSTSNEEKTTLQGDNQNMDVQDLEDDDYEKDIDEEEYREEDDLYGVMDTLTTEEGFIEDKCFQVIQNGIVIDDERKYDLIDNAVESIMDVDQEIMTLGDYYVDIRSELKKMRAIILKRKEHAVKKNTSQRESNASNFTEGNNKDIENR